MLIAMGNIIQLNATANGIGVNVDSAAGVVVSNNVLTAGVASDQPVVIGSVSGVAVSCVTGPNPRLGTWGARVTNSCTVIAPN